MNQEEGTSAAGCPCPQVTMGLSLLLRSLSFPMCDRPEQQLMSPALPSPTSLTHPAFLDPGVAGL